MYRFHSMRDVREITFSEDHTGTLRRGTGKEQQKDTRVVFFDDIPRDLLPRWRLLSYDYLLRASGYRSVECLAGPSKITLIICMRNTLISRAVGNKMATKQHCASGLRYVMQFENNSCLSNLYLNCYSAWYILSWSNWYYTITHVRNVTFYWCMHYHRITFKSFTQKLLDIGIRLESNKINKCLEYKCVKCVEYK